MNFLISVVFREIWKTLSNVLRRIVDRFDKTGDVSKGKSSGRPQVGEDIVEDLREGMEQNPRASLLRLSAQSGVPLSTCQKIVNKKLNLHPHKVSLVQELKPADYSRRVAYYNWFLNNMNDNKILELPFFSDEAWFHLSGYVNSQNCRIWSTKNPHVFQETPLHAIKVGVWLAVSRRRVIGPVFFHYTTNGTRYKQQILEVFMNQLDDEEL
jgi:hypothetical protein